MEATTLIRSRWLCGSIAAMLLLTLAGCAGADHSSEEVCLNKLDNRQFADVAGDSTCTDYQRASAELGLAGFTFAKVTGQSQNLPAAMGLTAAGCATTGTDSLSAKSYDSIYQMHFFRSEYYSRDKYNAQGLARTSDLIEISFFGTLGDIAVDQECQMDANLDGTVTQAESNAFLGVTNSGTGSSSISDYCDFQLVAPNQSAAYILRDSTSGIATGTNPSTCHSNFDEFAPDTNFDGLPDAAFSPIIGLPGLPPTAYATGSAMYRVAKVDSIVPLFQNPAHASVPTQYATSLVQKVGQLSQDLTDLAFPSTSDLRTKINDAISTMDNGGSCANTTTQLLTLLEHLAASAAQPGDAATVATSPFYENYNILPFTDIGGAAGLSTTPVPPTPPPIGGVTFPTPVGFKLVYATAGGLPVPTYSTSASNSGMTQLTTLLLRAGYLNFTPGGNYTAGAANNWTIWPRVLTARAGDLTISFRELACIGQ